VETLEECCPRDRAEAIYQRLLSGERSPLVRRALKEALEDLREDDE
jgi:hypothetical protein